MMGSLLLMPEPGGLGDNADDENKNILMKKKIEIEMGDRRWSAV